MYCNKLKAIVNSTEGIKSNIDMNFIHSFDKCLKDKTTERERLKLDPIKISNEMNIPQKKVMEFFMLGKKIGLFEARLFYRCRCNNYFEIHNINDIKCENGCYIEYSENRKRIYVCYRLKYEVEECNFGDFGEYPIDYILDTHLGEYMGTLNEYDDFMGEEKVNRIITNNEDCLTTIKIAHISDLHFGSGYNRGMDNKNTLSDINDITPRLFENFKRNICKNNIDYLIISGDITTRNETNGYEEFAKNISNIDIPKDNIYIVPGNHECNRAEQYEKKQFADFIAYTNEFHTPFNKEKYIIDRSNKIFIYGFNSINYKKDGDKELFYIKNTDFDNLDSVLNKLNSQVSEFDTFDKIAVMHNNLTDHPNVEIKEYSEMLNLYTVKYRLAKLGFRYICSGHKHDEVIEKHTIYNDDGSINEIILLSAASLCGNVINTRNGFHIIKLHKDRNMSLKEIEIDKYEINKMREYTYIRSIKI